MKVVDLDRRERSLNSLLRLAKKQPLILVRKGKSLVAVLDLGHEDLETLSLRTNVEFLDYLKQSRARHRREGGIRLEDLRLKYGMPPRARGSKNGR